VARRGYIAHLPLKYFSDISLELFPGKLIRGRIISVKDGNARIELGGAQLEAQTSRIFNKGDSVTLRVTDVTKDGLSLEIVDSKTTTGSQAKPSQANADVQSPIAQLASVREQINKLMGMASSAQKTAAENSLADTLKNLLEIKSKHDFFFLVVPIYLDDGKHRQFELLMRKIGDEKNEEEKSTSEFLFSVSTSRLGDISGRILSVGRQLRVDLNAESESTVNELKSISEPLSEALSRMGFYISMMKISKGRTLGPIERFVAGE